MNTVDETTTDPSVELDAEVLSGQCTAFTGDRRCQNYWIKEGIRSCAHKHVKTVRHCSYHVAVAQQNRLKCTSCLIAGHLCVAEVVYR